jgi:hypothetical protein
MTFSAVELRNPSNEQTIQVPNENQLVKLEQVTSAHEMAKA